MMKVMLLVTCAFVALCSLACSSGSSGGGGNTDAGTGTGTGTGTSTGTGTGTGTGGGGIDDCVRLCQRSQALHCPNDSTGDCSQVCQIQTSLPFCKMELAALTSCSVNAPMVCGSDGKATTQGCSSEGLAYFSCFLGGVLDGGLTD